MNAPSAEPSTSPSDAYAALRAAAQTQLAELDRQSARLANLRAVAFLSAAVLAGAVLLDRLPKVQLWSAAAALALYLLFAVLHQRVFTREARARLHVLLNERGLARLNGGWHQFEEKGERFLFAEHLYAADLDVVGQGSAFQLLNETATRSGEERLAAWLLGPAPGEVLRARQGAVQELASQLPFRQALCVEGRSVAKAKPNPRLFIEWAEAPSALPRIAWARPLAWLLPLFTLSTFVLRSWDIVPHSLFWAGLFAQLAVVLLTRGTLKDVEARLQSAEGGFVRYGPLFELLERSTFQHPLLSQRSPSAAAALRRFSFLFSFAEFRRHQFHPVVHLLTLWDVHCFFALENWRKQHGAQVASWFHALAELEALSCLAGLAHDRPDFTFPELTEEGPLAEATALGHPLLLAPVLNDVSLSGPGQALLITGSNMSGKTTLMRALGLNAVLGLAGAPTCTKAFKLSADLQVLTSMRVKDSLERGVSYFYAEVQRLKALLDAATLRKGRALFLLDEILLGTNTRERQWASREVLALMLETGACGAVTTHDLFLAQLEGAPGFHVRNVHFRDHLQGGEMHFDYQLREGVVATSNALQVLRSAGIPIRDETPS